MFGIRKRKSESEEHITTGPKKGIKKDNKKNTPTERIEDKEIQLINLDPFANSGQQTQGIRKSKTKDQGKEKVKESKMRKSRTKAEGRTMKASMGGYLANTAIDVLTKGEMDIQTEVFQITPTKIMGNRFKRVLSIVEYPEIVQPGFLYDIRRQLRNEFGTDVDMNIIFAGKGERIPFGGSKEGKKVHKKRVKFHRDLWQTEEQIDYLRKNQNTGSSNIHGDLAYKEKQYKRLIRKTSSYKYIEDYQAERGNMLSGWQFVEIISSDIDLVDAAYLRCMETLKSSEYICSDVRDLEGYLNNFGLAKNPMNNRKTMFSNILLTPTVKSLEKSFLSGIVRTDNACVYAGHDINSGYPIHLSFNEGTDAMNMLMLAKTRSGKTVAAKSMVSDALLNESYRALIHCAKGDEWASAFQDFNGSVILRVENSFINTLRIPDYELLGLEDPKQAFNLSQSITVAILTTLATENWEIELRNVCEDIAIKAIGMYGVNPEDPITYSLSQGVNFRESIWSAIESMTGTVEVNRRHGESNFYKVRRALEKYFHPKGSKSYYFNKPINIEDILNSTCIVVDYATQTSSSRVSESQQERDAKYLQIDFLSSIYTIYNKKNNLYTIEVEEEVATKLTNPFLAKNLNRKLSGEGSSNKSNILITAALGGLIVGTVDDKESSSSLQMADIAAIRASINMLMIGKVKRSEAKAAIEAFALEPVANEILEVASNKGRFKRAFYVSIDTMDQDVAGTVRFEIPDRLIHSDIYASRLIASNEIDLEDDDDDED